MDLELSSPVKVEIDRLNEEAYCTLINAVGWEQRSRKDARQLLANALVTVVATSAGIVVGMGRASGDGRSYAHVSDIAVDPAFQGQQIGAALVQTLLDELDRLSGSCITVTLNATTENAGFYERFGFVMSETPNFLVRPGRSAAL